MGNITKASHGIFGIVIIFLAIPTAKASDNLEKELACYRTLKRESYEAPNWVVEGYPFIPGSKNGERGFYHYSERMAYFCKLPKKPAKTNREHDYYHIRLHIPGKTPVLFTYNVNKTGKEHYSLSISYRPKKALKKRYVPIHCSEYLTGESRKALLNGLKKSIEMVFEKYQYKNEVLQRLEKLKQHMEEPIRASATRAGGGLRRKGKVKEPMEKHKGALTECMKVPGLKEASKRELKKFPNSRDTNLVRRHRLHKPSKTH